MALSGDFAIAASSRRRCRARRASLRQRRDRPASRTSSTTRRTRPVDDVEPAATGWRITLQGASRRRGDACAIDDRNGETNNIKHRSDGLPATMKSTTRR